LREAREVPDGFCASAGESFLIPSCVKGFELPFAEPEPEPEPEPEAGVMLIFVLGGSLSFGGFELDLDEDGSAALSLLSSGFGAGPPSIASRRARIYAGIH
jgi:hypothetical protein